MSTRGMIVAAKPEAIEAGAKVLMEGGNALDAAGQGIRVKWESGRGR